MNQIGRRIFYDKATGNVILDTGEKTGAVTPTTIDQDFATYSTLKNRVRSTVGVIELSYGQYAQDFAECSSYRVNLATNTLRFSYPDPNAPETAEPVYEKSLTEKVTELEKNTASYMIDLDFRLSSIELGL